METPQLLGKKILIIDDDIDLIQLTSMIFKRAGAQVITAHSGWEGVGKMLTYRPHLVLLDVMMPGASGFEVCQKIRQVSNIPLIMISALGHDQNHLQGLEAGADDFVVKPFNPEILISRTKALLRRSNNRDTLDSRYNDGHLEIDADKHQMRIDGKPIRSTPIEFRLLLYLQQHAGRALSYDQILENVWGEEYRGSVNFVHVYISHLRNKIEKDPKKPRYIQSVHGVGYRFERGEVI
jgi:two-component system alkaline phosphatase synthesis response regulator PhoP